jgi:hypothetical protein
MSDIVEKWEHHKRMYVGPKNGVFCDVFMVVTMMNVISQKTFFIIRGCSRM